MLMTAMPGSSGAGSRASRPVGGKVSGREKAVCHELPGRRLNFDYSTKN